MAQPRLPSPGQKPAPAPKPKVLLAAPPSAPKPKPASAPVRGSTSWSALNQAISRIPNYRPGVATWSVTAQYGHWGATDLPTGRIYISPNVPVSKLYSVAAHEYGHALTSHNYGRNYRAAGAAMSIWFGGPAATARELAADCMARLQGATWTAHTSCTNAKWRQGARTLLAGHRLP